MNEDDFLFGDEEDEDLDSYIVSAPDEDESDEDDETSLEEDESTEIDEEAYKGKLSEDEIKLIKAYNDIAKSSSLVDSLIVVVNSNPRHTSSMLILNKVKELMNRQAHSRLPSTKYKPNPLRGEDVNEILDEGNNDTDVEINAEFTSEMRDLIDGFINYLATRDLSKDSVSSRRKKQRILPAFIIFMFNSGMYDFVVASPAMPAEYQDQINFTLKKITEEKLKVVEELAEKYDSVGRPAVAKKVRDMGLSWFDREPAEIMVLAEYKYLNITSSDLAIYREFRPRFTNLSKSITQDVVSDYVEVVLDAKKGIYEKLKDKTRADAITDMKKTFKEWVEKYQPDKSGLATKLIFNN